MGWFVPALIGAAVGGLASSKSSKPKAPEKMSYKEAYGQAEDAMGEQYRENRERMLDDVNRNMISSGFYGQAPGDYLKQDAMTDMEADYESQKSRYAQNLRNTDYAEQYQQYEHQLQGRQNTFGNVGTGAALGYQIGGGWGAGLGALAGAFF